MNSVIRNKLIIRPLAYAVAALILALVMIYFVPHQLSEAISTMSKSKQSVQFPPAIAYALILVLMFRPLYLLASNLLLIRSWQKGETPSCPVCSYPMIQRVAKRGRYSGQRFWGCVGFPKCAGKIHIG